MFAGASSILAATSSIEIRVNGANAASAVVTAHSKDEPSRSWTAKPDETGRAVLAGLPSGSYRLTIDLAGAPQGSLDLSVGEREIVTVEATLGPGKLTLRVSDRFRVGQGLVLDRDMLDHLPSSFSAGSLIETSIPGPIPSRIDGGGIGTGDPAVFSSRGASWTTTSYVLGDVDVTNPSQPGTPLFYPDLRAFGSVGVTNGIGPVEFGEGGATVSLMPQRPGAERHGAVEGSFTTAGMVATAGTAAAPAIAAMSSLSDGAFEWSGPLTKRVGLFLAASRTASQHVERADPTNLTGNVSSVFANIVAHPDDRDEVRIIGALQDVTRSYSGRAQLSNGAGVTEQDTFGHAQFAWDRRASSGTRWLVVGGFSRGALTPDVSTSATGGAIDVVFGGPMPSPPSNDVVTSWSARAQVEPRSIRVGGISHSLRADLVFDRDGSTSHQIVAPTVLEVDGESAGFQIVAPVPVLVTTVAFARYWVWQPTTSDSSRHGTNVAAYASDRMVLSPTVTAEAGLRFERASGAASGAPQGITWSTGAPRASVRWMPGADVAITAAYGRSHPRLPLNYLAWGDPSGAWATVYLWNPAGLGQQVGRAGAGPIGTIDPALKAPHTDEYVLSLEAKLNEQTTVRGSAVIRREKDLVGQTDSGVNYNVIAVPDQGVDYTNPADDRLLLTYSRVLTPTPADSYQLTNPAGATARYDGIEIELEHHGDTLSTVVGAMAYRSQATAGGSGYGVDQNDQGVIGNTFADPNMTTYAYGRPFFDRAYVLKWSTLYRGPHDVRAAITARYEDGQPFSRLVLAQGLAQGGELVPAYPDGLTRFTFTVTIDARVEKGFALGHGRRIVLALDAFNLTNMANQVEENPLSGPTFRQTTAVQPPGTIRLGFKFEF
jgi:hypothetical protein